jgi:hypothetical protein
MTAFVRVPSQAGVAGILAALAATLLAPTLAHAQYFGRNKVQYETFDWRVLKTDHFDVHYYPEEEQVARDGARMSERWYARHAATLAHTFDRKALVFYANHPDFQQTNVISGMLNEGTGGVTEGLRTRVILPFTGVYADNDHVIGHELVHVFQYDIAQSQRGVGLQRMSQLPLWLIEGMAEYLSIGREDPQTAMWLRDAALHNRLPTIKQLTTDSRFFPYRYGQALWAYIGGRWGDDAVNRLYRGALAQAWDPALKRVTGMTSDSLSKEWIASIRADYLPLIAGRTPPESAGVRVLAQGKKTGDMNLSPALSPDGRFVAFFSRRGLFSVDLYVADARTGRVRKRLSSPATDPHFDAVSFLYSAGAWSPESRKMAYIVVAEGDNEIAILDVNSGRLERRIHPEGIGAISTLSWSPDGRTLAISGIKGGMSDLFLYDLESGRVRQLTTDRYADLHPTWSPDGRTIAFVTDRGEGTSFETLQYRDMRLAVADASTGALQLLPTYLGGNAINPQWTPDGRELVFVSDADGFRDIYKIDVASGRVSQLTRIATGVSGITALSPAITVARQTGQLMFSVFERQGYSVYALDSAAMGGVPVAPSVAVSQDVLGARPTAALLPPLRATGRSIVSEYLRDPLTGLPVEERFTVRPYRSTLSLEAIGQPSLGVATGGPFGTGVAGGVSAFFGDILGNQRVGVALQATGDVKDVGGELFYLNAGRRWNWVAGMSHVPYLSGFGSTAQRRNVTIGGQPYAAREYTRYLQRVYFTTAEVGTQYPFSTTRRAELSIGATRVGYSTTIDRLLEVEGQIIDQQRTDTTSPPAIYFGQASAALVGDNSFFGFTSPVYGWRYHLEASPTFGGLNFQSLLADSRRYFFARPFTFALRGLYYGRYGNDAESDRLSPLYIGHSTLVRGYRAESFDTSECVEASPGDEGCPAFDRLLGSQIAVANVELRVPLFGTEELGLLNVPFLPVEIAPFADAGVAWTREESPVLEFRRNSLDRIPVFSAGVTARINLFGYAIGEVYLARPFQRPEKNWDVGFQLAPGW